MSYCDTIRFRGGNLMHRHLLKRLTSIALAIVLFSSSPMMCFASQVDVADDTVFVEIDVEESASDNTSDIDIEDDDEIEDNDDIEDTDKTEAGDAIEDAEEIDANDEESSVAGKEADETISEEDTSSDSIIVTEEDVPVDYEITSEELAKKSELASTLSRFDAMTAGIDYSQNQVYRVIDSEESALKIAEKYDAELASYEYGIAVYTLSDKLTVSDAIHLAADITNDYPAVYPDYYSNSADDLQIIDSTDSTGAEYSTAASANANLADENGYLSFDRIGIQSFIIDSSTISDPFLNESSPAYQWHHAAIGSTYSLTSGITGDGVKIALLSTGINTHNEFGSGNIVANKSFVSGDSSCTDSYIYGTFLAGLLVSDINGSLGAGICPDAKIINVRIKDNSTAAVSALIYGIYNAINNDADIILIQESYDFPITDVEKAVEEAYSRGIAVFAPTASTGDSFEVWPAAYNHVISVAAIDKNNMKSGDASISKSADFSAPGTYIYSCNSGNTGTYIGMNGTAPACAIAVGEAAVILSFKDNLAGFHDRSGNLLTKTDNKGAFVDALKKVMQSGTVSTGANTGKGMVYLPKVLGLSTVTTAPAAPTIEISTVKQSGDDYYVDVAVNSYDYDVYGTYSTFDGKIPSYKNGAPDKYSTPGTNFKVYLSDLTTDTITIKSIVVNSSGMSSKVATKTFSIKNLVCKLNISSSCNNVVPGKSVTFAYSVLPSNANTKRVEWHVSMNGSEATAKEKGITITATGKLNVGKNAPTGTVKVWAVSKIDPSKKSNEITVSIIGQRITSLKPVIRNMTIYRGDTNAVSEYELYTYFDAKCTYSNYYTKDSVYFTFSNPNLAEVNSSGYLVAKAPGSVVITIWAKDGSGIKATLPVTIIQKATEIKSYSNGYDKVAAGKTLVLKTPEVAPANAKVKKVTSWDLNDAAKTAGIKVSNGRIITTKTTPAGTYTVTAFLKNPDNSFISKELTFEVIPAAVTKITTDKTAKVFRTQNHFGSPTYTDITVKIVGGERIYNMPVKKAFEIKSSNPNLLSLDTDSISTSFDGTTGIMTIPVSATGMATGKVNVTVQALDGSNLKATCSVTIDNPVSEIKIAPTSATANSCVTIGKTLPLKATVGTEYGKLTNKAVTWELNDTTYATISATGVLKPKANAINRAIVVVKATAKDGSGAVAERTFVMYKNIGKMIVTDASGNVAKAQGTTYACDSDGAAVYTVTFYVMANGSFKSSDPSYFGGFRLGSSNPKVGQLRYEGVYYASSKPGYYIYEFKAIGIKKGNTNLKISTLDGSQSVTYNLKVQ